MGLRRFVALCKTAPYRNSLTYLLTYYAGVLYSVFVTVPEILCYIEYLSS